MKKKSKKIHFEIPQDNDNYPGISEESMWAVESEEGFNIDNIPMFVRDISPDDLVSVKEEDGVLFFDDIIKPSKNSVLRVFMQDTDKLEGLIAFLKKNDCEIETSHIEELFAINIPSNVSINIITKHLQEGEDSGFWEYEEGSIRHSE